MAGLKKKFATQTAALNSDDTVTNLDTARTAKRDRTASTAPGQLLEFQSQIQAANTQVDALQDRVRELEQGDQVVLLDPKSIVPSKLANRHASAFKSDAFKSLKVEIKAAGGNLQPIKVRPMPGREGQYEVVFGHRRHQACSELNLPVLAMVQPLNDADLFLEMDRENRERSDLSPYEQGIHYKRALDMKIYSSARKLSEALGISNGRISQALVLAELPGAVINAFGSPLELQFRWGKELKDALTANKEAVMQRAKAIRAEQVQPGAAKVLARLLGEDTTAVKAVNTVLGEEQRGRLTNKDGEVLIRIERGALTKKQIKRWEVMTTALLDE